VAELGMGLLSSTARKIVFWTYPRTSWQWDVLCLLILVFIFLTPKGWFETRGFRRQKTVVIAADVVGSQADRDGIGRRAKEVAARPEGRVIAVRNLVDANGKLVAYEVDIR
jgi:hypothetical protein